MILLCRFRRRFHNGKSKTIKTLNRRDAKTQSFKNKSKKFFSFYLLYFYLYFLCVPASLRLKNNFVQIQNQNFLAVADRDEQNFGILKIECHAIVFQKVSAQNPRLFKSRSLVDNIEIERNRPDFFA